MPERESINLMLEALKMDQPRYQNLLTDFAFTIIHKMYPGYQKAAVRTSRTTLGLSKEATEEDFKLETDAENTAEIIASFKSVEEIEEFCKKMEGKGFKNLFDRSELNKLIIYYYGEMEKERKGRVQ